MPLTVAVIDRKVVNRTLGYLTLAGMSTVTDGTNADLVDPITSAFMAVTGLQPASIGTIADSDVAQITDDALLERFVDAATIETFRTILGRLVNPDMTTIDGTVKFSQQAEMIRDLIVVYEDKLNNPLRPAQAAMGKITAAQCIPNDPAIARALYPAYRPWPTVFGGGCGRI